MAHSSSFIRDKLPVHDGVERAIAAAEAIRETAREARAGKRLPSYAVGLTIMATVTLTARALDDSQIGFATELLALSAVAVLSFVFLSSIVRTVTKRAQGLLSHAVSEWRRARSDERLWAFAGQDSRVMNEIIWAKNRDEATFVDEVRAPLHMTQREVLAERRIPSPVFTKYY